MSKKITIHDIAKALNTTAATVSRALNDHPRISDETKKRVRESAVEMGYEPNHLAAAFRKGKSNTLGVIVPLTDRSFFSSVIRGLEEVTNQKGYNVLICQSHDRYKDEIRNIDALLQAKVSGIVISISKESAGKTDHLHKILNNNIPLIMFDRISETLDCNSVIIDDHLGGYLATEHLIKKGFKKICCFYSDPTLNIYRERFRGYQDAMSDYGLSWDESMTRKIWSSVEEGKKGMASLLEDVKPPFGLFCTSDYTAIGALQYLRNNKVKVPEQVSLVGFSNEPVTQYLEPPLSTVDQKAKSMGEVIAKTFLEQMENDESIFATKKVLKPELLVRGT